MEADGRTVDMGSVSRSSLAGKVLADAPDGPEDDDDEGTTSTMIDGLRTTVTRFSQQDNNGLTEVANWFSSKYSPEELDAKERYTAHSISFTGLNAIIIFFPCFSCLFLRRTDSLPRCKSHYFCCSCSKWQ